MGEGKTKSTFRFDKSNLLMICKHFTVTVRLKDDIIGKQYSKVNIDRKGDIMHITDDAKEVLKEVLQDKNASGIRVFFSGFG